MDSPLLSNPQILQLIYDLKAAATDAESRNTPECDERAFHEGEAAAYNHALKLITRRIPSCPDCGGGGFTEDFDSMTISGMCKTCGGTGRVRFPSA